MDLFLRCGEVFSVISLVICLKNRWTKFVRLHSGIGEIREEMKLMKKNFKVCTPKWHYKLMIAGFLLLVLIPVLFYLIEGSGLAGIIVSAVLFSPFLVAALWSYRFRITVRENNITVRRGIGKEYSFNVNEITKVVRRVNRNSDLGTMVKITIYTKSRHVSVETLMTGCDKMESYIAENVDAGKIITKERKG